MTEIPPVLDLVAFLEARIAEDEQTARNASMLLIGGDREVWKYDRDAFAVRATHGRWNVATRRDDPADSNEIHMTDSYGEHIVANQPARVLREVAAKRVIIKQYRAALRYRKAQADATSDWAAGKRAKPRPALDGPDLRPLIPGLEEALRLLATAYSVHSEYDPEWTVS